MSNEKIRAMMAKITLSHQVFKFGTITGINGPHAVLIPIPDAKFHTDVEAEMFIRENIKQLEGPLTIVKIFE